MIRTAARVLFPILTGLGLGTVVAQEPAAKPKASTPPTVVRVSAIPDFNKKTLNETAKAVCDYLGKQVGIEFRFEPSSDYTACVNGLAANKLDLVWFGGLTAVEAMDVCKDDARLVACRDVDLEFKTYFIANKEAIQKGKVKPVDKLEDLKPMLANLTFTFGDKKSTSGHLMPRHFLVTAGIDPEKAFKSPASFRLSGGHAATMQAVSSGEVDLGALNYVYYDAYDYNGPYYYPTDYRGDPRTICARYFRSFEWDTGLYTTYRGEKRMCPYLGV